VSVALADWARALDNSINRRGIVKRRHQGWIPRILPYTGYGSMRDLHVLARAIMADPKADARPAAFRLPGSAHGTMQQRSLRQMWEASNPFDAANDIVDLVVESAQEAQRGWRQFFTTQVGNLPVTITIGDQSVETRTDSNGYIDLLVSGHGLAPGWHEVRIKPAVGEEVRAPVVVVDPAATTGLISDIDDTIVITWLPRMFIAAWNAFFLRTDARKPVPGMADFYHEALASAPNAPVFYLSTGAWNTLPAMQEFINTHGLPAGPLLMTDWGPTSTGLFRSGQEHKRTQLRNLLITFPNISWILVGDDGQYDPLIYDELAREFPSRVKLIALRLLNPVEQVLAHGYATPRDGKYIPPRIRPATIPLITGRDGRELRIQLRAVRAQLGL
jgi:phosphatidate phosphatase APP1